MFQRAGSSGDLQKEKHTNIGDLPFIFFFLSFQQGRDARDAGNSIFHLISADVQTPDGPNPGWSKPRIVEIPDRCLCDPGPPYT